MTVDYTAAKDAARLIPTGSAPDFAGDVNTVIQWLQAGRSYRKTTTYAALAAESDMADNDLAVVENIDGAHFKYDSAAGLWRMHGIARFADSSARATAIASPVVGMLSRLADSGFIFEHNGTSWLAQNKRIIPSAATNGTVSATGVVTSTAQTLVRVRDAFPAGYTVFRIQFDITTSAAASLAMRLAVDGTDATTAYDEQRVTFINATAATVQALNGAQTYPGAIGVAGARHFGEILITDANVASPTYGTSQSVAAAPAAMTTSTGAQMGNFLHRTSTAYNSINFYPGSGNVTVNRLTVEGVS